MQTLCEMVDERISALPYLFAIIVEFWSAVSTHYIASFAEFVTKNDDGYNKFSLAISPIWNENSPDANEHFKFLYFVFCTFGDLVLM